jgi:hypothetical protein
VYLDTDVVLAHLKADDWLGSVVDLDKLDEPKTSVATCIEVQYAMEGEWEREQLTRVSEQLEADKIELIPLEVSHVEAGSELQRKYATLNLFDAVHLGTARVLEETIVSTDTLYPEIEDVSSVDPRELK